MENFHFRQKSFSSKIFELFATCGSSFFELGRKKFPRRFSGKSYATAVQKLRWQHIRFSFYVVQVFLQNTTCQNSRVNTAYVNVLLGNSGRFSKSITIQFRLHNESFDHFRKLWLESVLVSLPISHDEGEHVQLSTIRSEPIVNGRNRPNISSC